MLRISTEHGSVCRKQLLLTVAKLFHCPIPFSLFNGNMTQEGFSRFFSEIIFDINLNEDLLRQDNGSFGLNENNANSYRAA